MTNLSNVFKYISYFRHAGHQVGRKVGDMLEVLTYASIARDSELLSRLHVEPKFYGFAEAGHKIEFVLLSTQSIDTQGLPKIHKGGEITNPSDVISFIECKKVGVEQTVNGNFKRKFTKSSDRKNYIVPFGTEYTIAFAPRGQDKHTFILTFNSDKSLSISKKEDESFSFKDKMTDNYRLIIALGSDMQSMVIGNDRSLRDFETALYKCKILEIVSVGEEHVTALLNDCLAGPQTPEKAKQASFVALDIRKKRFDSFDKRSPETEMISVLVLTEFSHWEQKSQNIVRTCIDKILIVPDEIIVESFKQFQNKFGDSFYDMITKDNFEKDSTVRELALNIVNKYNGKIFLDLDDDKYKKFVLSNNLFSITE